jgi:hypothetical protein
LPSQSSGYVAKRVAKIDESEGVRLARQLRVAVQAQKASRVAANVKEEVQARPTEVLIIMRYLSG